MKARILLTFVRGFIMTAGTFGARESIGDG